MSGAGAFFIAGCDAFVETLTPAQKLVLATLVQGAEDRSTLWNGIYNALSVKCPAELDRGEVLVKAFGWEGSE